MNASRSGDPSSSARDVIFPAAVRPVRIRHVARRLLEVRHQAAPLENFREDVRHALAGEVRAAELSDRVVAVFVQHAGVQLVRAGCADSRWRPRRAHVSMSSPRNSSRNRRRSDFADREYRAKSAPFTVSGRFVSAKTGRSVFVK